jgi:hypothetical protein
VGEVSNSTNDSAGTDTTVDSTASSTGTDTSSDNSDSTSSQYTNPLDAPEEGSVIGKTIIVNGKAVILSNNRDEKVYDGE